MRGSGSCVISCRPIFNYQILTRHSSVQPRHPRTEKKSASPNPDGLPSLTHLFVHLSRPSCPRTLSLRSELARTSCHKPLVIAMERSDRRNLLASRSPHCVRDDNPYYARNDKNQDARASQEAFAMTTCQQMAASS